MLSWRNSLEFRVLLPASGCSLLGDLNHAYQHSVSYNPKNFLVSTAFEISLLRNESIRKIKEITMKFQSYRLLSRQFE